MSYARLDTPQYGIKEYAEKLHKMSLAEQKLWAYKLASL